MKLLIRAPNWLGDCVMALPAFDSIRAAFPDADIVVAARRPLTQLYEMMSGWNGVSLISRGRGLTGLKNRWSDSAALRGRNFDAVVLFPNSIGTAIESLVARIPVRIGYARGGRGALLTHPVSATDGILDRHQIFYYLRLAERLAAQYGVAVPPEFRGDGDKPPVPSLTVPESVLSDARALIQSALSSSPDEPFYAFAAGAAYGSAKEWPREHFAALAKIIRDKTGERVIVVGGPGEADACAEVESLSDGAAVSLAGKTTLPQLAGVLSLAKGYVGNDSGASHLAAAVGTPSVVLFGSTKMTHTAPVGTRVSLLNLHLDCAPCMKRVCPLGHRNCLRCITPEMAADALAGYETKV